MTYSPNGTIPEEVLELIASQGLEAVTELIRRLIGHPTPAQDDPTGERFTVEKGAS